MKMYVLSIYKDTITCNCQEVIWGQKSDTVGFLLNNKEFYFKKLKPTHQTKVVDTRKKYERYSFYINLDDGDQYSIYTLILKNKHAGMIIFINNNTRRLPSFVLSNKNLCKYVIKYD